MIAGIELGKKYAQVCVKTDLMKEPESVSMIAGAEHYRIPIEANLNNKTELQEIFRKLWKLLIPYGSKDALEILVFCLEDNSDNFRERLLEIVDIYNIAKEKVYFLDKKESFCAYVFHQSAELLTRNALLIENVDGKMEKFLLHKRSRTIPYITEIRNVTEKTLEQIFSDHGISSVFLVGDDFEEAWMQKNLKLLKSGRRVFIGKNLFVKGACYRGGELKEKSENYLYLSEEKVCCNIALRSVQRGEEVYLPLVEGGRNWYESNVVSEVLLLEEPELEFCIFPLNGKEKTSVMVSLNELPQRPKKTTRLQIEITFLNSCYAILRIKDLGFGELFPASDMKYEGELRWEQ